MARISEVRQSHAVDHTDSDSSPALQVYRESDNSGGMFVREDWTQFRGLATLCQRAGVPEDQIPDLVAKELVDNALDAPGFCQIEVIGDNGIRVTDDGGGIPGDDHAVARLFSINRPLTSSKTLRRPTRGALGNGLRVVMGAVVATGGTLLVSTCGRTLRLNHDHDSGDTIPEYTGPWNGVGTDIEVTFGNRFTITQENLVLANTALMLVGEGSYKGKSSPLWYELDAFYELLQSAKGTPLRKLVAEFDGYGGRTAAVQTLSSLGYGSELCRELSKEQSKELLGVLRSGVIKPVQSKQLGKIGPIRGFDHHARVEGTIEIRGSGGFDIVIPVAVEAWTRPSEKIFNAVGCVNRTAATENIKIYKDTDKYIVIHGFGFLGHFSGNHKPFDLIFNIDTPYMPIVTDGKAPNLRAFSDLIKKACQAAARKIAREKKGGRIDYATQKEVIIELIPKCVKHASGDGKHRFNLRQLFYSIRPLFSEQFRFFPEYGYFSSVVTEYENVFGEIDGLCRDPRGVVYHPHTGEEIPLGTLAVDSYDRPDWLFNKVLCIEKEGFVSMLLDAKWPERIDCALLTSKGQLTRAAKDLIDFLGDTGEPCEFFIIHDADAAGTMIYQCLQEATAARGARNVEIINLGLEPHEGREMGLDPEDVTYKRYQPVADYVPVVDDEWLQTHRIELNAMTTAQFLKWLDMKFLPYSKKVMPPVDVMKEQLNESTEEMLRDQITEEVLDEAGIDGLVDEAMKDLAPALDAKADNLVMEVGDHLEAHPSDLWKNSVKEIARGIVEPR